MAKHDTFPEALIAYGDMILFGQFKSDETVDLPRLVFHFNRVNFGRLRQMIDFLNAGEA